MVARDNECTLNNQLEIDAAHPKRVQRLRQLHSDEQRIREKNELERQIE